MICQTFLKNREFEGEFKMYTPTMNDLIFLVFFIIYLTIIRPAFIEFLDNKFNDSEDNNTRKNSKKSKETDKKLEKLNKIFDDKFEKLSPNAQLRVKFLMVITLIFVAASLPVLLYSLLVTISKV